MSSFTDAEEEKLINMVISYDILYNPTHANYKSNLIKDKVWKKIGNELNRNGEECKKKWRCIRDSYHRFKKKTKCTGSPVPKHTKDRRHILLSFLDSFPQHRSGSWSWGNQVVEETADEDNWRVGELPHSSTSAELSNHSDALAPNVIINEEGNSWDIPVLATVTEQNGDEARPGKKRRSNSEDHNHLQAWEEQSSLFKTDIRKGDDVNLFCRHLEEVLRNLPPVEKARAKMEINNILSKYEIIAATKVERLSFSSVSSYSLTDGHTPTECNNSTTAVYIKQENTDQEQSD